MVMSQKRTLWNIALDQQKDVQSANSEHMNNLPCHSYMLVCGSKQSGKTSLIQRFLDRDEAAKPTTALEFYYGRKSKQNNMATVKDVTQIWELGGGGSMSKLVGSVISAGNIRQLKIVLMLDLSKPKTLWDVQHTLLTQMNQKISHVLKEASKTNRQLEKELKEKAWLRIGENHKDKNMMSPFLLPLVIIGSKFDIFQQELNNEERMVVLKTLRFLANSYGAMIQFFSTKAEGLIGRAKSVLSHLAFGTQLSKTTSLDPNKPLIVPFGQDNFEQIGAPPVSTEILMKLRRGGTPYDLWRDVYNSVFPSERDEKHSKPNPTLDKQFANELVDSVRQQKDQELDKYRKLCERKLKEAQLDANVGNNTKQRKTR